MESQRICWVKFWDLAVVGFGAIIVSISKSLTLQRSLTPCFGLGLKRLVGFAGESLDFMQLVCDD